jgi:hypothetical protein
MFYITDHEPSASEVRLISVMTHSFFQCVYFLTVSTVTCEILPVSFELKWKPRGRISGSHGGEYEDGCLLGCSAV